MSQAVKGYDGLDDFLARARERLDPLTGPGRLPAGGDIDFLPEERQSDTRPAGVLAAVIPRSEGAKVLFTVRPHTMANHAGQVAFPGGKVDPVDKDEVDAALREAEEEVGASPSDVSLVGRGAPYVTGTGFRITPVLGVLPADFAPRPDPHEVADVFETPLDFLMNPANHEPRTTLWRGKTRRYYAMPHGGRLIWGVTAGVIRALYMRIYAGERD